MSRRLRALVLCYVTAGAVGAAVLLALVGLAGSSVEVAAVAGLTVAWLLGDQARRLS
jgi:hypothetical protein